MSTRPVASVGTGPQRRVGERDGVERTGDFGPVDAVHGRLGVEQRLLGMVANLWLATIVQGTLMAWVGYGWSQLMELPWVLLLSVHGFGLTVMLGMIYVSLPRTRWQRRGSLVHLPSIIPLSLLGFPALLFYPLLIRRDHRARDQAVDAEEVELAFRQLLNVPRVAGGAFMLCAGVVHVVSALFIATEFALDGSETIVALIVSVASILPYVAIANSRGRAILRGEYLSAPRSNPKAFPIHRDLRVRLGLPAGLAAVGAVLVPVLGAFLWSGVVAEQRAEARARASADELIEIAQAGDEEAIGRFFADHPGHSLSLDSRQFGIPEGIPEVLDGAIDTDGDGHADLFVVRSGSTVAAVEIPTTEPIPTSFIIILTIAGLATALPAVFVITRDVCRDIVRTTEQVDSVARGRIPSSLGEESFSTRELRQLVQSVDRLVTRITETNVAKYIVIEKAQEADRLKSQFLANMSHDLRSPLNSILGFSDLLISGIDGEITDEQREMCETIHASGRELLQQIDDILDTAKIEAGRMDLHPEPSPPAALVSKAVQSAQKRQGARAIRFETTMAAGLPPAFVDSHRTTQAIENVLVFAGERMTEGVIDVDLSASRVDGERMVMIEIRTPTRPASAEQLSHVLRGFFRIPGHTGLGLGLPIAGSILELQSGSLGIEEEITDEGLPADGMSFILMLPAPEARRKLRLRS